MANQRFYIKQGDTKPDLVALLRRGDGSYPDLSNVQVTCHIKPKRADTPPISRLASTDNLSHMARHVWQATDTQVAGARLAEFEVVQLSDNSTETFPNHGFIEVYIEEEIG